MKECFNPSSRVLRISASLLIGLLVACVVGAGSHLERERSRLQQGGDFPAFYSAGLLAREGRGREIYSRPSIAATQLRIGTRSESEGFLLFGYPPYVAALFAPLTLLPYESAVELYFILNLSSWFLSVWVLVRVWPSLRQWYLPIAAFGIASYPTLRAILGGQNSALSVLCLSLCISLLGERREGVTKEIAAGIAMGLWLFKPQLALPFLIAALLWRRWWVGLGASVVGAIYWILGTSVGGNAWLRWWIQDGAPTFYVGDLLHNAQNFINLRPVVHLILGNNSTETEVVTLVLSALLLLVSLLAGLLLFRSRSDLYGYFAFLVPLSLIASPHALYYDAALLVVPCAWLMMRNPRWYTMPLAIAFLVTWLSPLWPQNFVHPVTLLCIGLAVLIVLESREQVT